MPSNDKTYPLMLDYIPEEYIKIAQEELKETAEKTVHFIRDLMNMAKADETLKDIEFQPDFLRQFLRVSKYNADVAFKRLCKYTTMRKKFSSFFTGVQGRISSSPSYKWTSPLPWRSFDGCTVYLHKFGIWDNESSYEDLTRLVLLVIHQLLRIPVSQINGFRVIMDFRGTSLRQVKYATPSNVSQVAEMFLECVPARFKGFHVVNGTLPMRIAYRIVYPILTEKLKKRIFFHKHLEELFEYIPKHALPVEYGGNLKNYYMYSWMKDANDQMILSTFSGQRNFF